MAENENELETSRAKLFELLKQFGAEEKIRFAPLVLRWCWMKIRVNAPIDAFLTSGNKLYIGIFSGTFLNIR